MWLLTQKKVFLTKIGVRRTRVSVNLLFEKSGRVVQRNHGNKLPRDDGLDLGTNLHPTTDLAYGGNAYSYKFSGRENPLCNFSIMFSVSKYVWDSWKLVSKNGKLCAQSRKSHVQVDTVCPGSTVSAASVPCDFHRAELGSPVSKTGFQTISNAENAMPMEIDTTGGISNLDNV